MVLSQTDPELLRQLDDARGSGDQVQAVVKLHRTPGKAPVPAVDRGADPQGRRPDGEDHR